MPSPSGYVLNPIEVAGAVVAAQPVPATPFYESLISTELNTAPFVTRAEWEENDEHSGYRLTGGADETYPRNMGMNSTALGASQALMLTFFEAKRTRPVTTITGWTGATAAAATPTICRYGLYLEDLITKNLTLVASTPNDTTLFAATNTIYPKNVSSIYTYLKGRRYALGVLVVSGVALPTMMGFAAGTVAAVDTQLNLGNTVSATVTGQADLPASVAKASVAASRSLYYLSTT